MTPAHNWDRRPNRPARPRGWAATRRRILDRDQGVCWICGRPGADQVDHKVPLAQGGTEDDSNLGAVHGEPCHAVKTAREAAAARAKKYSTKRPPERHPGLK